MKLYFITLKLLIGEIDLDNIFYKDIASGSNDVCVLLHTSGSSSSQEIASTGSAHIVWSWQATSPVKSEDCAEFNQSTINMRDLE